MYTPVVNSVGDAFAFPFRDPNWAGKIVVQALILIIPIVGLIATAGWMLMTFDNLRAGRQELAPAGFHLSRGIGLFGAWFLYAFVLAIPGGVLNGIGRSMSANHAFTGSPLAGLGFVFNLGRRAFPVLSVAIDHRDNVPPRLRGRARCSGVWRL